jgi:hypothetical protein
LAVALGLFLWRRLKPRLISFCIATLRGQAPAEDIAAFSITQDAIITIWNVVLGVAVMLWAFGYGAAKDLVFKRKKAPETRAAAP